MSTWNDGKVALVSFGRGGHTEHPRGGTWTLSGYDSPDTWKPSDHDYAADCVAMDTRGVDFDKAAKLAIRGPMLDCNLADGELSQCPAPSDMMLAGLGGEFRTLALLQKAGVGCLDSVSRSDYVTMWRDAGARVGTVVNGQIDWKA